MVWLKTDVTSPWKKDLFNSHLKFLYVSIPNPFYLGQEIKVVQYTQLELLHLWHCQIDSPKVVVYSLQCNRHDLSPLMSNSHARSRLENVVHLGYAGWVENVVNRQDSYPLMLIHHARGWFAWDLENIGQLWYAGWVKNVVIPLNTIKLSFHKSICARLRKYSASGLCRVGWKCCDSSWFNQSWKFVELLFHATCHLCVAVILEVDLQNWVHQGAIGVRCGLTEYPEI